MIALKEDFKSQDGYFKNTVSEPAQYSEKLVF